MKWLSRVRNLIFDLLKWSSAGVGVFSFNQDQQVLVIRMFERILSDEQEIGITSMNGAYYPSILLCRYLIRDLLSSWIKDAISV